MFCPACVRGPALKGSAADKKASAAALSVTPSRKPRTCGEKPKVMNLVLVRPGSPPHVRGKVRILRVTGVGAGITPACAGKRLAGKKHNSQQKDHPRMCGEKLMPPLLGFGLTGSPPHVRGKDAGPVVQGAVQGITPAYAGKMRCPRFRPGKIRDHPRTCGGKAAVRPGRFLRQGITPAYAGKRAISAALACSFWDHPRMCGEKACGTCA